MAKNAYLCTRFYTGKSCTASSLRILQDGNVAKASEVAARAGAHFVKTSTGFSTGGATLHAVEIMKANCGNCKIKASGGIRDAETAAKYIEAGVSRIGTSSIL